MMLLSYVLVLVFSTFCVAKDCPIVNCYFGTWSNYRPGNGKFTSSDIDPNLCTHVSYTFFGITDAGAFKVLDSWLDFDLGSIKKLNDLKAINPSLKTLAVVGGWKEESTKYSAMAADPKKRKTFIQSSLKFIQENGFDGLDLDWEYPAQRGGSPHDKHNLVTLLKEIREAFKSFNLELGIAVGASANTAKTSYDIPNISKHLDFINVMTYDFAMADDGKLGFNAPLHGQGQNNVEDAIKYWLANGAPASKLVLGLASYGRTFQLANTAQTTPGSTSAGPGQPGPFTAEGGYLGYNEICLVKSSWTTMFDDAYGNPYMYKGNQWVSYDDVKSIELKMDFLKKMNLRGAMLWSIETDDFRGDCGEKYPLLNAINRKMGSCSGGPTITTNRPGNTTTRRPVDTTTRAPTAAPPSGGGCSQDGYYRNESDCNRFYQCAGRVRYDYACAAGLKFDNVSNTCVWPNQTTC